MLLGHEVADLVHRLLVQCRIANDAAAGDVFAAELELRLDQADERAAIFQHGENGGQDLGQRNEGKIHDRESHFFADVGGHHVARIELLFDDHARVIAQFPDQLVGPDIHGVDAAGPALQQAVGETAGGRAHINADPAVGGDLEGVERAFKLQSATADVALLFFDFEGRVWQHLGAGLVDDAVAAAHFSGKDQSLGLLARVAEATGDEKRIDTVFFHQGRRTKQEWRVAARRVS